MFHFGSNLPKKVPNHYPEHYPHESDLATFLWDWRQREKLSEIKPPLPKFKSIRNLTPMCIVLPSTIHRSLHRNVKLLINLICRVMMRTLGSILLQLATSCHCACLHLWHSGMAWKVEGLRQLQILGNLFVCFQIWSWSSNIFGVEL